MALIIKGDMPLSCFGCEMYEFWKACPLHNMAEVELESWKDTEGIHPSCPILGAVNLDGFTRVIVTSGDGTVVGYKDVSARQVLRIGGTDRSNAFPLVEANTEAST